MSSDLNIRQMYRLCKEKVCDKEGDRKNMYRDIFCKEYNLAYHQPKKDQSDLCAQYNTVILKKSKQRT